jgi:hypothetical protein
MDSTEPDICTTIADSVFLTDMLFSLGDENGQHGN